MRKIIESIRISIWFLTGFTKKHYKVVSISFFVSVLVLLLVQSIYPHLAPYINPKNEKIGIVGIFNPTSLPLSVQSLISSGLTSITLEGSAAASLATDWTVTKDGKVYVFNLRKDIIWHDEKPFTAYDVNYNLKDAIIIPKSDYELEVRLNESYVPLPVLLSRPLFKKGLIGVGNYQVSGLKLNGDTIEYIQLVPVTKGLPKKMFRFYPSEEDAITAFKLGEINSIEDLSDPKDLSDWPTIDIQEKVILNKYIALFFNTQHEYFKDKDTRQIISIATPALYGEKPLGSISPLSWAYYPKVKQFDHNIELTQKRLQNTPLATSSATVKISTFPNLLPTANKISEEWQKAGLISQVEVVNSIPEDFQVLLASAEISPDPDQYPQWHSTQTATNITRLSDPKIDKLLEDGRVIKNPEERLRIYADFQRFLAEESPAAFLYYPRVYTVKRK